MICMVAGVRSQTDGVGGDSGLGLGFTPWSHSTATGENTVAGRSAVGLDSFVS